MKRLSLLLPISLLAFGCGEKDPDDSGDVDADGDGVFSADDCDDDDPDNFPGNDEVCDDADNDCDGVVERRGQRLQRSRRR